MLSTRGINVFRIDKQSHIGCDSAKPSPEASFTPIGFVISITQGKQITNLLSDT